MKTMEEIIQEAAEFLFESWKEAIESGESEDAAQMYAWETMRAHYAWRGITDKEEQELNEAFMEARHRYYSRNG